MTLLIKLERQNYTNPRKEIDSRIDIGLAALKHYLRGYFEPTDLEIWRTAPMSELEGEEIVKTSINIGDTYELRQIIDEKIGTRLVDGSQLLSESIIRVNGIWKLDGIEQRGFFSINNASQWRGVYGDIDVDVYPGMEDDITTLFWSHSNERKEMVDKFFENFLRDYNEVYTGFVLQKVSLQKVTSRQLEPYTMDCQER